MHASMSMYYRNFDKGSKLIDIAKKTNHKKREIARIEPFIDLFGGDKEKAVKLFKLWKDSTFEENGESKKFKDFYIKMLKQYEKMKMDTTHFKEIEKIFQE
jgi:hypothetical protein